MLEATMKAIAPLLLLALVSPITRAQDEFPKPSLQSQRYSEYRHQSTDPLYSVAKVKAMIKSIRPNQDDNRVLSDKAYNSLSSKEKFSYAMLHGEEFSQNCDAMPPIVDEHKKVFAFFPGPFGDEAVWSERQRDFLTQNRTTVIGYIRETMKARKRVGVNLKQAIYVLKAKELVPDLVALYSRDHKDHDLLSLMMILMADAKYPGFTKTQVFAKLYGENANWGTYVEATKALQSQVIRQALAFSRSGR